MGEPQKVYFAKENPTLKGEILARLRVTMDVRE